MLKVIATVQNIIAGFVSLGCTVSPEDVKAFGEVVHLLDAGSEVELENRNGKITLVFLVDTLGQQDHLASFTIIEESLGYSVIVDDAGDSVNRFTLEKKEAHMSNSATPSTPLDLPGSLQESLKSALEQSREATQEAVSITKEFTQSVDMSKQLNKQADQMIKDGAAALKAQQAKLAEALNVSPVAKPAWYKGTIAKLTLGAAVVGAVATAGFYSWKAYKSAE